MAYSDFVQLYAAENKRNPEDLLAERPLNFAMATNDRGEALIGALKQWSGIGLSGKRVLDVGCAYGGLSIALANAGASVVGIESNPKLLAYAEANTFGTAQVTLSPADISTISIRQTFEPGSFDLIFLNDALERHFDIDTLVSNVDHLLAADGLVHFRTINSNSTRFILSDGHKKVFGLPLIEPDLWHHLYQKRAAIYYRPISTYLAMFQYYGMPKHVLIDEEQAITRRNERRLGLQIKEIYSRARAEDVSDPLLKSALRKQTTKLRDRYQFDLEKHGSDFVRFKYGSTFLSGCIGRREAVLQLNSPTSELAEFGSVVRTAPANANIPLATGPSGANSTGGGKGSKNVGVESVEVSVRRRVGRK